MAVEEDFIGPRLRWRRNDRANVAVAILRDIKPYTKDKQTLSLPFILLNSYTSLYTRFMYTQNQTSKHHGSMYEGYYSFHLLFVTSLPLLPLKLPLASPQDKLEP